MGRRKGSPGLTPLELEIMQVLWHTGPANVLAVREGLAPRRPLAYTTVQTMLNLLVRKGKVRRTLRERRFYYRPAVTHQREIAHMVGDLVGRLFGGSPERLVLSLMESRQLTPEALDRLAAALEKGGGDGGR